MIAMPHLIRWTWRQRRGTVVLGRRMRVYGLSVLVWLGAVTGAPAQNQVLELDGTGAHVELPVAAFEGLREATVEAWVRWDEWGYFSQWFAYGTDDPWRALGVNHFSNSPVLQFFIYPTGVNDLRLIDLQVPLSIGRWHHMAAVSGSGGMRFYFDGVLVGSDAYAGSFADLGRGTRAFLGRSTWEANSAFRGALDEVRLWSVARSAEEVRADMGRALHGDESGLAGLWNFDAGDARDGSSHGHDGTLRDGARCEPLFYPGAQPRLRPAVLRGEVRDESGAPVMAAQVRLSKEGGRTVTAASEQYGTFAVAVLDTGVYTLEVYSDQVKIPGREVAVTPGAELLLDLRPPPLDLVARWSAEGDARDGVGEFHGHPSGDVTFAPGVVGQAFHFGGEGSGVVRVPNTPELNPQGSFSLMAWVFPESDRSMTVLSMWGDINEWRTQRAYSLGVLVGRRLAFSLADSLHQEDSSYHRLFTRPNVLALHAWTLIAGVWDAESGERRLYANGRLVGRRVDAPSSTDRSIADLSIGTHQTSPELTVSYFTGRIDEAALYGVALSDGEIARLYSAHAQAQWPAEGNATDATRSGHDGVAVGNVGFVPGVSGQAFAFDGRDSYIEFDPRIGNYGTADFSVELWLRHGPGSGSGRPILIKGDAWTATLKLSIGGAGQVNATLADRQDSLRLVSAGPLSAETWHHVALVREGQQACLYLDGEFHGEATTQRIINLQTASPLLLGGIPETPSFAGRIDEVALHRRPLSADEIRVTYNRVESAWRWKVWRTRLQTWSGIAVGLLALLMGGRYASQRRVRRREREQLAAAERARQIADDASAAKSAFLAHVSHEIRTPLNAILGHAQVLRDKPSMADGDRRSLEAICQQGGHLLQLLNDILNLSKVEAGRLELQITDFHLGALVDGLTSLFELRCRQKGLQFRVEADADLAAVRGDESKLRQVLVNLLSNAVKFTDAGEVVLRAVRIEADYLFEVRDTGPGIAPELQDVIFQPFQQAPLGLAVGGTGLGLPIARRHVELMGSRLEMASTPGHGARFYFRVSLEAGALPEAAATPGSPASVETFDGLALPAALRARLQEAAQMQNLTEVKLCLEQMQGLGEDEARLAATLRQATMHFDLKPVLRALEGTVDA